MKLGSARRPGSERPYARSLSDVLSFARDRVGVVFSYVSIANEVDNASAQVRMTPAQVRIVDADLIRMLRARGLHPGLLAGDNTSWPEAIRFSSAALRQRPPSLAGLASHAYRGDDNARRQFAELARVARVPV